MEQQGQAAATAVARHDDDDDVVAVALSVIDSATQAWGSARKFAVTTQAGREGGER